MSTRITRSGVAALFTFLVLSLQVHAWERDILRKDFGYSDSSPSSVPMDAIQQGCDRRDCIASIDTPKFLDARAARYLADDDLVLGLQVGRTARAYPVRILNYHEVVNDTIEGEPVAISFCPLCGSGTAFSRRVRGRTTTFGISGLLYNSDLIMYDRASNSLWQQITGTALVGPRRGEVLANVPVAMTSWAEWRAAHPETTVLAPPDANGRYAVATPYGDYDSSARLMFPVSANDPRIHPKTVVFGIVIEGQPMAVSERLLSRDGQVTPEIGGRRFVWSRMADGSVEVRDAHDKVYRDAHRMFWFAWFSFNPGTRLSDTLQTW
jgi:hypothetical protein